MSKLNLLISLNSFADAQTTNNPALSHFRWTREVMNLQVSDDSVSQSLQVQPGQTKVIFDHSRALSQDGTTAYTITASATPAHWRLTKSAGAGSLAAAEIGDTIILGEDFLPANQGQYEVTAVDAAYVEFAAVNTLTLETVTTQVVIASSLRQLIYVESNRKSTLLMNGANSAKIEPFIVGTDIKPGMMLNKATCYSLTITNDGTDAATVFFAGVE